MTKLNKFRPQAVNANKHTARGMGMLRDAIGKDGWIGALTVAADNQSFDGSARLETVGEIMADAEPIVVESDGTRPVIVRRTDIATADDPRAKRLAIGANRIQQVDLDFDADVLAALAGEIDLTQFWNKDELSDLLKGQGNDAADPGADIDRAGELQEKWGTALGQLWQIGEHRLLCGDCTVRENVERVMGGEKAQATITDPPYNVGIDYGEEVDDRKALEVYEAFSRAWFALAGELTERQIVTPGCNNLASWLRWFDPYHVAPWTKTNAMTNGKVSRWWCWEPVLFFGTKWARTRTNDVFDYPVPPQTVKGMGSLSPFHPCPKPLPMYLDLIENYSDAGQIIYEPFGGSGTTFVACLQRGRVCIGTEIDPNYTAVILERLSLMGLAPVLVD